MLSACILCQLVLLAIKLSPEYNVKANNGRTERWKPEGIFSYNGVDIMSKSQDSKKAVKKAPTKTPKEKKEAKKIKKEAMKRQ